MFSEEKSISEVVDEIGFGWYQIKMILIMGLLMMTDAIEILLLTVIGPLLRCEWFLTEYEIALITTFGFIGMSTGSIFFGYISDKGGRIKTLLISATLVFYFGCFSGFSHSYIWILIFRTLVGVGVGGMLSAMTPLLCEVTPTPQRTLGMAFIMLFSGLGVILESVLAYIVGPTLGWQALVILNTAPILLGIIAIFALPESPHYLLLKGREKRVQEILKKIAHDNKKRLDLDNIRISTSKQERGGIMDLFHKSLLRTTLLVNVIWFSAGFIYYGNIILSTTISQNRYHCLQNRNELSSISETSDYSCCVSLTTETYMAMLFSSIGELMTFPNVLLLSNYAGRKWSLCINFLIACITFITLDLCMPQAARYFILLMNRVCSNSAYVTVILYSNEVYPSSVRSSGIGVGNAMSCLGALVTPFVAQVMYINVSALGTFIVYTLVALFGCLICFMLPFETKGNMLALTVHDKTELVDEIKGKLKYDKKRKYKTFENTS